MADAPIHVLKFGSSVLPNEQALPEAVHEIYRRLRDGCRVVAVVSALGPTTDKLIAEAESYGSSPAIGPSPNAYAALVATGESRAVALLTLALGRAGVPAKALDSAAIGLSTQGPLLDGRTTDLNVVAILRSLDEAPVLVVPGFLGRADDGSISLLGRGGSDLTALFLAAKLGARCTLLKDVDGLYDRDPAGDNADEAQRFDRVSYDDVLRLSEGIVQHKAVRFARDAGLEFEVSCCGGTRGTVVGRGASTLSRLSKVDQRVRIALLGLGTVGRGVFDELQRQHERFEVVGVLVRDIEKHAITGVPINLLTEDDESLVGENVIARPDILVEALGGLEPAAAIVQQALEHGVHVVTANKQLIAERGDELKAIAARSGARLLYSAAVGGAVPMLETVRQSKANGIHRIEGVINGTTNFILNRVASGLSFDVALAEAQRVGFAEADPTDDLDGVDAARKLVLLCREAWDIPIELSEIRVSGIRGIDSDGSSAPRRLVARAESNGARVNATVALETLPVDHPLADLPGVTNALTVETQSGDRTVVRGLAAGRWPTSESVLADVLQIRRETLCPAGIPAQQAEALS